MNQRLRITASVITLVVFLLAGCSPAATTATEPPTSIPPTNVPATKVPPTPEPVTLTVTGSVTSELQLTESALRALPVVTLTLEHPKNGPTEYTGVRLSDILNQAGLTPESGAITVTASDGFSNTIELADIQGCSDCMIAFDTATPGVYNAAMPGLSSKAWVKMVSSISVAKAELITLTINGKVANELIFTDSALHALEVVTLNLTHPKDGAVDFTGVRINDLLALASPSDATNVNFIASDGFTFTIDLATVQVCSDCLLAFDSSMPGVYNLAFAGQTSGKAWIKNLVTISLD